MRNAEITLVDITGRQWDLNTCSEPVRIVRGGLPELYGRAETRMVGGRAVSTGRALPGGGTLTVGFYPTAGVDLNQVRAEFRAGWSNTEYCHLTVTTGVETTARIRLADDVALPPRAELTPNIFDTLDVTVAWDDGVWLVPQAEEGPKATVVNAGVVDVRPGIYWQRGGTVTLYSGYTFTLPTVPEPRVLWLDRERGFPVEDMGGERDSELTSRLWGAVREECVPAGQQRTLTVPEGAHVAWNEGVSEPWR